MTMLISSLVKPHDNGPPAGLEVAPSTLPEAAAYHGYVTPFEKPAPLKPDATYSPETGGAAKGRRTWFTRSLLLVGVVCFVIAAAVVGGAVGGTLGARKGYVVVHFLFPTYLHFVPCSMAVIDFLDVGNRRPSLFKMVARVLGLALRRLLRLHLLLRHRLP